MDEGINVISLFDGISCAGVALERAGFLVNKYYAAEIDKYAIQISQNNFPDIIRLGDVQKWENWDIDWSSIDLVLAGFPCQAWSMAGKQLGDRDERGMLFWTMLDIISHIQKFNPKVQFLIENVKMKKEFEEYITHHTTQALGDRVHKILINSALVSAQNRNRYYWTSWANEQPKDRGVVVGDIIEGGKPIKDKYQTLLATIYKENAKSMIKRNKWGLLVSEGNASEFIMPTGWHTWFNKNREFQLRKKYSCIVNDTDKAICMTARQYASWTGNFARVAPDMVSASVTIGKNGSRKIKSTDDKLNCLTPSYYKGVNGSSRPFLCAPGVIGSEFNAKAKDTYRKLTPVECERLQTLPDNYTAGVSRTQRYKALGNGWTVDVITHLLKNLKVNYEK